MTGRPDVLRVGNCSGFYGDRLSAMREMLCEGQLDVLTGDYLAELTLLILGRDRIKDPSTGYARTFLTQAEKGNQHDNKGDTEKPGPPSHGACSWRLAAANFGWRHLYAEFCVAPAMSTN